ncbi:A-kinase anchor protein 13-like [Oncorhynchus keta]|uniref:A-kinase anchor protein 13-like n=1 Tax=Oncorhynchus keta TaxID=8018 RepID=UPI00227C3221|nr:A-kinase anchor protein 13-like [Oncorhynchus keta]
MDSTRSFSSTSGSLAYSISEEDIAGPLRTDFDGKSGTKVSRTFSYLKNKIYKKTREKDGEKSRDKDERREAKARERCTLNGHHFSMVSSQTQSSSCHQCSKTINTKDAFLCTNCNSHVHKSCRESLPVCAKVKMKSHHSPVLVPDLFVLTRATTAPSWSQICWC